MLSPNLFKIFINDIFKYIKPDIDTPVLANEKIQGLIFADDIVLCSKTERGLQKLLTGMHSFCHDWKLNINMDKTHIMVFNRSGKMIKTNLTIDGKKVTDAKEYKYLGIVFSPSGKFTVAKKDLLHRGYKAVFKLTSSFKELKPNVRTCMHLFDHIVRPILLYGSEIWGDTCFCTDRSLYNVMIKDIIEKCHLKFCRYTLGVTKHAPNLAVYGDMGRYPMGYNAAINFMKYWHRVANMTENDNILLFSAFIESKGSICLKQSWFKNVEQVLHNIGEENNNCCSFACTYFVHKLRQMLQNEFVREWKRELFNDNRKGAHGNKLRCYRTFKSEFKTESYLDHCQNIIYRKSLANYRMSSHKLKVETGRYCGIPVEERLCLNCEAELCEDEFHFLMTCSKYNDLRNVLFNETAKLFPSFNEMPDNNKFIWLLSCKIPIIVNSLAKYICNCMELRC